MKNITKLFQKKLNSGNSSTVSGPGKKKDVSRILLLILLLVTALAGGFYDTWRNNPERMVKLSIKKALDQRSFSANINGVRMLGNAVFGRHRLHQKFTPTEKLHITELEGSANSLPVNAYTALRSLEYASKVTEHDRVAMYSHVTRYFSGSIEIPEYGEKVGQIFEYWIDYRTRLPVRLVITRLDRQNLQNRQDSVSIGTYIDIRFSGWSGE